MKKCLLMTRTVLLLASTSHVCCAQIQTSWKIHELDSYETKPYADGQAAAVYGQYPPLVNASRPPGQWQAYDIVFHGPRFDKDGKLLRPASVTVFHNGVLAQDHVQPTGPTAHG